MKCYSGLYPEATNLKFCFKNPSLLSFLGGIIIHVEHYPRISQQPPQKPKFVNMKNALFRVLLRNQA
jgi:hypothetical protein